ncbi:hypothetical protein Droror1_Dr00028138 [Drosera rotundifolia]
MRWRSGGKRQDREILIHLKMRMKDNEARIPLIPACHTNPREYGFNISVSNCIEPRYELKRSSLFPGFKEYPISQKQVICQAKRRIQSLSLCKLGFLLFGPAL